MLDMMILSGVAAASTSANTRAFKSGLSGTFSWTMSALRAASAALGTKRSFSSGGAFVPATLSSTRAAHA